MVRVMRNARITTMCKEPRENQIKCPMLLRKMIGKINYMYLQPRETCLCVPSRLKGGEETGKSVEIE